MCTPSPYTSVYSFETVPVPNPTMRRLLTLPELSFRRLRRQQEVVPRAARQGLRLLARKEDGMRSPALHSGTSRRTSVSNPETGRSCTCMKLNMDSSS